MSLPNAAIWYIGDGYDTSGKKLMGRQAAGENFLKAYVNQDGLDELRCMCGGRAQAESFAKQARELSGRQQHVRWYSRTRLEGVEDAGVVYYPGPAIAELAWQRRYKGQRTYSLNGVFHTTASHRVMDTVTDFLLAPLQAWDAVVCTSNAMRATVEQVLDSQAEYLRSRLGVSVSPSVRLPVIPLGADVDQLNPPDKAERRAAWRTKLGIQPDEVCVLFMGRLSFHAKAHPLPMYLGLEAAAKRCSKKVVLIQAGWTSNEKVEELFKSETSRFAPSVRSILLDGRLPKVRQNIWFAADIFTSLSDNIQETFGLVPAEAMAAGLPVVVTDWDGYRDTVRHGVEGFCVPTWQPRPGAGDVLAKAYADGALDYDHYVGIASQFCAVDIPACIEAYAALIGNAELRAEMGSAGLKRARDQYDWPIIVRRYRELWAELEAIRGQAEETAPRGEGGPAQPGRQDPFALFASYPTHTLDEHTVVTLSAGVEPELTESFFTSGMLRLGSGLRGGNELAASLLRQIGDREISVAQLIEASAAEPDRIIRALGWLAKTGLVTLETRPD